MQRRRGRRLVRLLEPLRPRLELRLRGTVGAQRGVDLEHRLGRHARELGGALEAGRERLAPRRARHLGLAAQRLRRGAHVGGVEVAGAQRVERDVRERDAARRGEQVGPPRAERMVGAWIEVHPDTLRLLGLRADPRERRAGSAPRGRRAREQRRGGRARALEGAGNSSVRSTSRRGPRRPGPARRSRGWRGRCRRPGPGSARSWCMRIVPYMPLSTTRTTIGSSCCTAVASSEAVIRKQPSPATRRRCGRGARPWRRRAAGRP